MSSRRLVAAAAVLMGIVVAPSAPAQAAKIKPGRPEILSVSSTPVSGNLVNIRVTFSVSRNRGSALKGTTVYVGGRTCVAKRAARACTLKGVRVGTEVLIRAKSRSKNGFGPYSTTVHYTAGTPALSKTAATTSGCSIVGTLGDDVITGTEMPDVICGMGGRDTINARGGDDTVYSADVPTPRYGAIATPGDIIDPMGDTIDGGTGNDIVSGSEGVDTISGDVGADTLVGDAGADVIFGQDDSDILIGGPGDDTLSGGPGMDVIDGGTGTNLCDMTDAESVVPTCTYDSEPPVADNLQVPAEVVAGSDVVFTYRVSDNFGTSFTTAFLRNRNEQHLSGCGGSGLGPIVGDARDGIYRQSCRIPLSALNGEYTITSQSADEVGNYAITLLGSFTVVGGNDDQTPPLVSDFSAPTTVTAGTDITVRYRVRDVGGLMFTTAWINNPFGRHLSGCGGGGLSPYAGNENDGWYQQTCRIPASASDGTWTVNVQFEDYAGNNGVTNGVGTFNVVGGGNDVDNATIENVLISSPVSVGQNVSFSFDVRDAGGVMFVGASFRNPSDNWVPCNSSATRVSGDDFLGHYVGVCTIPANSPRGTYTMYVNTEDFAGNANTDLVGTLEVN